MEPFVVTIFEALLLVGVGVVLAGYLTPIPWKFPNYDKQRIVNFVAGAVNRS